MNEGWVKLHRILLDKPIWQKSTPEQKVILITLLMMANHRENEWEWQGEKFKVKPGQMVTSLDSIKKECGKGISIRNIRTALNRFQKYEFLTNKSTKTGRLITIINWELYQGNDDNPDKEDDKDLTKTRQRPDKDLTTNKNDKNVRMEEEVLLSSDDDTQPPTINKNTPYQDIVDLYNSICNTLPKVEVISQKRKDKMRKTFKEAGEDIQKFKLVFEKANKSDFLSGRDGKWHGCGFDWLINYNNFIKVIEGNYDNKTDMNNFEYETLRLVR